MSRRIAYTDFYLSFSINVSHELACLLSDTLLLVDGIVKNILRIKVIAPVCFLAYKLSTCTCACVESKSNQSKLTIIVVTYLPGSTRNSSLWQAR